MIEDANDVDPMETLEWRDAVAVADVIEHDGAVRAHFLLDQVAH